jgi:ABC-type antimicrobial peptide transport system permease subunit
LILVLARIVESQLYEVKAHDPASILAAAAGVTAVAMLAGFLPARRATKVDPVLALRWE